MNVQSLLSRRQEKRKARQPRLLRKSWCSIGVVTFLFSMFILLLSACSNPFQAPAQTGGTDPVQVVTPTAAVSPTTSGSSSVVINFQIVGCPSTLGAIKWDSLVGTKSGINKVQKVTCGTFENGALAALVNVRYYSSDAKLDVYVYDNLFGTPNRRFALQGLLGGNTEISPTGTILTAENPANDPLGPNVFKEYQWDGSTFTQILFPGIFPDVTHYQAEQNQANVNAQLAQTTATPTANNSVWQNSAFSVVSRMAQNIFHWSPNVIKNTIITYNTPSSIFVIQTTNYGPGGGGFITSLFHLDNIPTNIFEVKQVTSIDGSTLLISPTNDLTQPLSSPVKVSGSYQSAGTLVGRVALYNDTYVIVGDSGSLRGSTTGYATFTPSVSFRLNARGLQEGVLIFYVSNQNNIDASNQVVVAKVFFSA
jgi:hypothetical protein